MAILLYYDDHDPPYFHVKAADFSAKVDLGDLAVIEVNGRLRTRDVARLRSWALTHRAALYENWNRAPARRAPPEDRGSSIRMMHPLHAAEGRRDFTVHLTFASGHKGIVDLSEFVGRGEVTARLRADPDLFIASLHVLPDGDGIGWPGDVDIDADALWYKLFPEDWDHDFGSRDRRTG